MLIRDSEKIGGGKKARTRKYTLRQHRAAKPREGLGDDTSGGRTAPNDFGTVSGKSNCGRDPKILEIQRKVNIGTTLNRQRP
jgi:hypothetical protein